MDADPVNQTPDIGEDVDVRADRGVQFWHIDWDTHGWTKKKCWGHKIKWDPVNCVHYWQGSKSKRQGERIKEDSGEGEEEGAVYHEKAFEFLLLLPYTKGSMAYI